MATERLEQTPDDVLVERYKSTGDTVFFGEVCRRHWQWVYRCCLALVRDREAAADQAQESFIKAQTGIHGYTGGRLRAWLTTIARHQCINHMRSRQWESRGLAGPEGLETIEAGAADIVGQITMRALLARLNLVQHSCLKLFYYDGFSFSEIADMMRLKERTVKWHIESGVKRMRHALAE
ncbi:MAG: sigma-70 family RNA polymerase sigma factor [Acidobacteria bacterium]|nr:sigma-70 family RNA polymerase sigma factor [Acidobacteriota bacterium]